MKKVKFLILPLTAAAVLLSACGGEPINQGPELRGINDITCLVNSTVDLLNGVAALDAEDGDITPNLSITVIPAVEVNNGYAVFTEAGDYEICYEVRDGLGKLARTTAFAEVIERDVYMSDICTNGFSVTAGGKTELLGKGLNGTVFSFSASGNEIAEDIKLSRAYNLVCGIEYTFNYYLTANRAGKIKAAADNSPIDEMYIEAGESVVSFKHKLPYKTAADGTVAAEDVKIELWLGAVEGDLDCSVSKAELSYYQEDQGFTENLPNFNFNGKILNRDDKADAVYASADGKAATVEINNPTGEIWQVGMFVNTGLELLPGETYYLSFEIYSELGNGYQICIQHDQWQDSDAIIIDTPENGLVERTITANDGWRGPLWLFIRSGVNKNKLTVSDLSVKTKSGGDKLESYALSGFINKNSDGGEGGIKTEFGKTTYNIKNFGSNWGNNELQSPEFALSGAADNYVIEFKAKASKPLNFVFLIHDERASDWTTIAWRQMRMQEGEAVYSVNCDNLSINSVYRIFWQFGNFANTNYHDVTVEISEIKICLKNDLEN